MCSCRIIFSIKPIFLESQEKKYDEKEQKQSLSKTEECVYAFNAVVNQKREQNLCCYLRAVEHAEQWKGHVHETKTLCIFGLITGLEMKAMVGAVTDVSIPHMTIIYINYCKHPASNNVTAVLLLLTSIEFPRRWMSFSLPNHDYLA